jgi:hypothetical protein
VSVEEFHRFNDKENGGIVLQENLLLPIWKPPPSGFLKADWDAAVKAQEGQVGVGIIVRDCEGCVLAARSTTFFLAIDPTRLKHGRLFKQSFSVRSWVFLIFVLMETLCRLLKNVRQIWPT